MNPNTREFKETLEQNVFLFKTLTKYTLQYKEYAKVADSLFKYLVLSIIASKGPITQKVCLNAYIAEIAYISQNSEDLSNLCNICKLFNLSNICNKKTNLSYFIIRIFDKFLSKGKLLPYFAS